MSARDDYPHPKDPDQLLNNQRTWERMCDEIDRLKDIIVDMAIDSYIAEKRLKQSPNNLPNQPRS